MKFKIFTSAAIYVALGFNLAQASSCEYYETSSSAMKVTYPNLPGKLKLGNVSRDAVMGSIDINIIPGNQYARLAVICQRAYRYSVHLEKVTLVEGYSDVYKTNVAGIGVRFFGRSLIPFAIEYSPSLMAVPLNSIRLEFVQTLRNIEAGEVSFDFDVVTDYDGWKAMTAIFHGTARLEFPDYFSGCAGVEKLNAGIGRVLLADFGETRQKPLSLYVLCSGAAADTKVPVKVSFEGGSEGPGRLSLEKSDAQGVELPFARVSALDMTWIRSEPEGEIYRLPVVAEHVKSASQKVESSRVSATVNYVLEYN